MVMSVRSLARLYDVVLEHLHPQWKRRVCLATLSAAAQIAFWYIIFNKL